MNKIKKYLKMVFPRVGIFTNGPYTIKGIMAFGKIYGRVVESYYPMVYDIGKFVILPEYRFIEDDDPQFFKID